MSNINNNLENTIIEEKTSHNEKNNEINNKPSWTHKIKKIINDIKELFNGVMDEAFHHINWTPIHKLWTYIKQFAIVAIISIIALFIMDNIIVYSLRWIFI